jgi:hypothetical protein
LSGRPRDRVELIAQPRLGTGTQDGWWPVGQADRMSNAVQRKTTTAFFVQAGISFGVSVVAVSVAIVYLPVGAWIRAFLGLGMLYVVTSSFTLAKCVRDQQEVTDVVHRVDQARLDKLLTDHDPFKAPAS